MNRGERPQPGRQYVKNGDDGIEDISDAATVAYGDPQKGALIARANPHKATGKIKRGEVIVIPGEKPAVKLTGRDPDDLTIIIDGLEVPMQSCKIVTTMDTGADAWNGRIAWIPGKNPRLDQATRPYGYTRAAAYIGNDLIVSGCLYTVSPEMTDNGLTKELIGYSFTADMIDSSVPPPYELSGYTLKQIADQLCPLFGIKAVFDKTVPPAGKFSRVTADKTETVFQHLSKLAAQRGILVSCTPEGDLLFLRANADQKPVGTLCEEAPFVEGWKATYDGRKRFHAYKVITAGVKGRSTPQALISKTPPGGSTGKKQPSPTVTEIDHAVPRSRFQTFNADDTTPGNIANAAKWRRNRQFVDALTLPFPVSSWYAPNGTRWKPNTTVTVISPTISVPIGFTFMIRSVEFEYAEKRRTAVLSLVPPQAYTDKEIGDIWGAVVRPRGH